MKNKVLTVLMVVCTLGLLVGCGKLTKATVSEGSYQITSEEKDAIVQKSDGTGDLLEYKYIKPVFEDKEELKFIIEDIEKYYSDYEKSCYDKDGEFRKSCEDNQTFMAGLDIVYETSLTFETKMNNNGVISLVLCNYSYAGGAHGSTYYITKNYNIETKTIVTLKDVFKNNYEEKLNLLIIDEIEKLKKNSTYEVAIFNDYADYLSYAYDDDSFYFEGDSIVFIYNEYEIAPYSEGTIEIKLQLEALSEYLQDGLMETILK